MDSVVGVGAVLRSFHVWHFMYMRIFVENGLLLVFLGFWLAV